MMIYLSGKITGDKNYKMKFENAAKKLISFGYDVFNPAILPDGFEYEQYMQIDFLALSFCQAVYLLDDWESSNGAKREVEEAKRLGLKIITEKEFLYSETLLKLCDDTEEIIKYEAESDEKDPDYENHLKRILNIIKTSVFFQDFNKTRSENFKSLCMDIPENDRQFFYSEFLRDAHIMIDYDFCEEDSCLKKNRLKKMFEATQEMRDMCCEAYGFPKEQKLEMSA